MNRFSLQNALLKKQRLTQQEALKLFDELEGVDISFMKGRWRGEELQTNHPLNGVLEATNWYGKEFLDADTVHPLLFQSKSGDLFIGNPGRIPFSAALGNVPRFIIKRLFPLAAPFLKTKKNKARLFMVEYRGKTSAAMVYDQKSVMDVFRKIDDQTVLGFMDAKNKKISGYFFVLKKEVKAT